MYFQWVGPIEIQGEIDFSTGENTSIHTEW